MPEWFFLALFATAAAALASRSVFRRRNQQAAADASGLVPVADLTHVPGSLQQTALWTLGDGGFEQRVVHGVVSRGAEDVDMTAFDLETLRERRGEWAYLPVDVPFRIGPVVSVVVCEMDRTFPHLLLKRVGRGDELVDDNRIERAASIAKVARDGLGMARSYPAELPTTLREASLDVKLPEGWRAYGTDRGFLAKLVAGGFATTLEQAGRRDLVIELIDALVVVYPAARDVVGADALTDLMATTLTIVDGLLGVAPQVSPRGLETRRVGA